MPCFSPLIGYRSRSINESGKRSIVFNVKDGFSDMVVRLPCGQCVGCRLERSRSWASRCIHEASLYVDNCFITLTYDDLHLPDDRGLSIKHWKNFMKYLRKEFPREKGNGIRFYMCGEYGEETQRPHYHACLFNFDFPDKVHWKNSNDGKHKLYVSPILQRLWPFGYSLIGEVEFESAAYVARYCMKKTTGKNLDKAVQKIDPFTKMECCLKPYERFDPLSGEVWEVKPEFTNMSRASGIGKGWYQKFYTDVFPHDFLEIKGKKIPVPKYYTGIYEVTHPDEYPRIKAKRKKTAEKLNEVNPQERLYTQEACLKAKLKLLKRSVE